MSTESKPTKGTEWVYHHPMITFGVLALMVGTAWYIYPLVATSICRKIDDTAFEGTEALFTGLAFAGLLVTIWLQRTELHLQRTEMEESRGVANRQREEMQRQADTMQRQAFEATFFQMLQLHHSIVRGIDVGGTVGRRGLKNEVIALLSLPIRSDREESPQKRAYDRWIEFTKDHTDTVLHVVRDLVSIIRYVNFSSLESLRSVYMNILVEQLANDELELLFYYTIAKLHDPGPMGPTFEDVKRTIENHQMFRHIVKDKIGIGEFAKIFQDSAYGISNSP